MRKLLIGALAMASVTMLDGCGKDEGANGALSAIPARYVPLCVVPVGFPADPSAKPKDKWKPGKIHKERF